MDSYFNNINITKRHFVVLGKTTDQFCNDALQLQSLEEMLHAHLKKLGYQRIIIYSPKLMLYCMDEDSHKYTQDFGKTTQTVPPPVQQQKRQIKLGPLSARVSGSNTASEEKKENKAKSWNLGKMNSKGAIDIIDKYMKDIAIKTALIITDTDFFITSFREVVGEGGRLMNITRDVHATLSNWDRKRQVKDKNIAVWIFQKGDANILAERLRGNDIWDRFFAPMFKEKVEKREGTLIDIPTAGSGEIKNLINHYRIMEQVPVEMKFINTAAQELEKLARGQSAFPDDNYNMMDMVGISSLILDTKNMGGININNIESKCGKNDRVSAFTKIEELSGMLDFKRCINELKENAKISNLQKETEIVYKDRLMRHPVDHKKELFNLHISLVGNPGTGKSTVAKLMGEVYHELGLLPTGHVVKVTKADLVAGYVGQTAMKTKDRINEAIGGVLFIDEAYMLAQGGENDYGQESIDTILEAMTDRMGEFAVIIAGYQDKIEMLLKTNPGLKSRFLERIKIEDYTANELADIFINDIKKNNFQIGSDLTSVLVGFMQRYYDGTPKGQEGEWANARTVINLSKKMRDRCRRVSGETIVDIKHIPHELKNYLEDTIPKSSLPKTMTDAQLDLPRADILKSGNEIDIRKMEQAVLFIENTTPDGTAFHGTGFLITPNGHFITCNHVIENAQEINARVRIINNGVPEDKFYKCELMNTFKDLDIALLKLEGSDLPYLNLEGDNRYKYEKGENVCLSGYPFGKRTAHDCTYTEGKISSTRIEHELESINLDISGKCGNSGGAVIDKKTGNVIGVFVGSITEGNEEINYMRPIKYFWKNFVR